MTGPLESGCPKSGSPVVAATHSELPPPENPATVPLTAAGDAVHATPSLENASTPVLAMASPPTLAEAVPSAVPAAVLPLARWSRAATEEEKETAFQAPLEPDHAKLREEAIRAERERLAPRAGTENHESLRDFGNATKLAHACWRRIATRIEVARGVVLPCECGLPACAPGQEASGGQQGGHR